MSARFFHIVRSKTNGNILPRRRNRRAQPKPLISLPFRKRLLHPFRAILQKGKMRHRVLWDHIRTRKENCKSNLGFFGISLYRQRRPHIFPQAFGTSSAHRQSRGSFPLRKLLHRHHFCRRLCGLLQYILYARRGEIKTSNTNSRQVYYHNNSLYREHPPRKQALCRAHLR